MLASYAVILRRSVVVTVPAALVMIAVSAIAAGVKGLVGALLGALIVAAFFGISALVITWVGRRRPNAAMAAAAIAYVVKIVVLLFFVARFESTTAFSGKSFGLTAIGCIIVWSAAQAVTTMRLKMLYVEPKPADVTPGTPDAPRTDSDAPSARYVESGGER
jgi:ATP synthase protein I